MGSGYLFKTWISENVWGSSGRNLIVRTGSRPPYHRHVIIAATIDEDGRVMLAEVGRAVEMLDAAALDAVKQWQ